MVVNIIIIIIISYPKWLHVRILWSEFFRSPSKLVRKLSLDALMLRIHKSVKHTVQILKNLLLLNLLLLLLLLRSLRRCRRKTFTPLTSRPVLPYYSRALCAGTSRK